MHFHGWKRRQVLTLLGGAAVAWPLAARAQQTNVPIVGFLSSLSQQAIARHVATFRETLKEAGYEEGKTVTIDYRWADGHFERLPDLASALLPREVARVVTVGGDPAALAAKRATSTIPIVFMVGRNPVLFGLVASMNRPGGNATGVNFFISETESKRIELLREVVPSAASFAYLINPNSADAENQIRDIVETAQLLRLQARLLKVSHQQEIEPAFEAMARTKVDALLVAADPFLNTFRGLIVSAAARQAIPAIYPLRDFVESGGLISYGASLADAYRQVAIYAGKILKGTKAAELPVVQPTKIEMVINLKTAKALGLDVPPTLLARADEVIE